MQQTSPLDREPYLAFITDAIVNGETNASILRLFKAKFQKITTEAALRRFRKRHSLQIPGVDRAGTAIEGDTAEAWMAPSHEPILDDPDTMLRQRGLDPEDWYIDAITVNEWDGPSQDGIVTLYQAKFTAKRKRPLITVEPARIDGWQAPPIFGYTPTAKAKRLVVIVGDQQAPFHDEGLHERFLAWLEHNQPDEGVELGDLIDLPSVSRYAKDPENIANVNECLQVGYDILLHYKQASPDTQWSYTPGNHDTRLRDFLIAHAIEVYGLKQADGETPGADVHSLTHLMRLDELDIEYIDAHGDYEDAQVELSPHLAVRHGWKVQKGAGSTALASLMQTGYSIVVGHTHRQSIVHHTSHDIYRNPTTLMGAEAGCMCRIDNKPDLHKRRFPSYTVLPDWQQGFCTATIYPDGKFKLDLATYVNETLLYRDQRY